MSRSFVLPVLAVLCVSVVTENMVYLFQWREDFTDPSNILKHWSSDGGEIWRISTISDFKGINNLELNSKNYLTLELNSSCHSHALYFQPLIQNNLENSKLSIFITVLGCNSMLEIYWKGRSVLNGPTGCPENMWIPLEFSSYTTEFDVIDLLLLVTGPLQPSSQPLLIISRLDVHLLQSPKSQIPAGNWHEEAQEILQVNSDAVPYIDDPEYLNSSSHIITNAFIILISAIIVVC